MRAIQPNTGYFDTMADRYVLILECGHVVVIPRSELPEWRLVTEIDCKRCDPQEPARAA